MDMEGLKRELAAFAETAAKFHSKSRAEIVNMVSEALNAGPRSAQPGANSTGTVRIELKGSKPNEAETVAAIRNAMRNQPLGDGYQGRAPLVATRVTPELLGEINRLAKHFGRPQAAIIRDAVIAGLPVVEFGADTEFEE